MRSCVCQNKGHLAKCTWHVKQNMPGSIVCCIFYFSISRVSQCSLILLTCTKRNDILYDGGVDISLRNLNCQFEHILTTWFGNDLGGNRKACMFCFRYRLHSVLNTLETTHEIIIQVLLLVCDVSFECGHIATVMKYNLV